MRGLDPADSTNPGTDLLAIYTRLSRSEVQLRLDWLDLPVLADSDLYLALDTRPGGTAALPISATSKVAWDILLIIPASGHLLALDSHLQPLAQPGFWSLRDPEEDTLVIGIRRNVATFATGYFSLEAFVTNPGSPQVQDHQGPTRSDDSPPPAARVLLAFWNALPAYTPAQALRRWDGAHTGPWGGRHGLYNLLRTARNAGAPLVLLDLKTPAALSALDFVGGLPMVRNLTARDLLILPDPYLGAPGLPGPPAWAGQLAAAENSQVAQRFGLPPNGFRFIPTYPGIGPEEIPSARLVFLLQNGPSVNSAALSSPPSQEPQEETTTPLTVPYRWQNAVVLPFHAPSFEQEQVNLEGPSLAVRRGLVAAAIAGQADPVSLIVLGGDLPASTWGNPQAARAAFRYLAAHPWVHILNAYDLLALRPHLSLPTSPSGFASSSASPGTSELPDTLQPFSADPLEQAAWETFRALYAPVFPATPSLAALRNLYEGPVHTLLNTAPTGEEGPQGGECLPPVTTPANPCWLRTGNFLAFFDLNGGALTYLFARSTSGWHQIIAPTSQFITGYSEPATWNLEGGLNADPAVIPGAFAGQDGPYQPSLEGTTLTLISTVGGIEKIFTFQDNQVQVEIRASGLLQTQIPLALDPWERFTPGWSERYQGTEFSPEGSLSGLSQAWSWQIEPGVKVQIQTTAQLSEAAFTQSRPFIGEPEDPNREVPSGHYLPFPLSLVQLTSPGNISVVIDIR